MAYPIHLAAYLSGASVGQIRSWRRKEILIPEVNAYNPALFSYRDLVALRAIARLRAHVSLQRIRKAMDTLNDQEFTEHLSEYRFATDGKSVKLWQDEGFVDLASNPGQWEHLSFADLYAPFENLQGRQVPDFRRPNSHIEVEPDRLAGWPTVAGTRVPYDVITDLAADDDITAEEIAEYYPTVDPEAVADVLEFGRAVEGFAA